MDDEFSKPLTPNINLKTNGDICCTKPVATHSQHNFSILFSFPFPIFCNAEQGRLSMYNA